MKELAPDNSAWNIAQAARFLGIAKITLYKYVEARTVPFIRIGRRVLFDPQDLKRWRDDQSVTSSG